MNSKSNDRKSENNFSFSKDNDDEFNLEYDPAGKLKAVVSFILAIGVGIFILSLFY